jgi:hypothetical protein
MFGEIERITAGVRKSVQAFERHGAECADCADGEQKGCEIGRAMTEDIDRYIGQYQAMVDRINELGDLVVDVALVHSVKWRAKP